MLIRKSFISALPRKETIRCLSTYRTVQGAKASAIPPRQSNSLLRRIPSRQHEFNYHLSQRSFSSWFSRSPSSKAIQESPQNDPSIPPIQEQVENVTPTIPQDPVDPITNLVPLEELPLPLSLFQSAFEHLHIIADLPYYQVIILGTIIFRLGLTLPITIIQQRRLVRFEKVVDIMKAWEETMKRKVMRDGRNEGWGVEKVNTELKTMHKSKLRELYAHYRCRPVATYLVPWIQIPLFISLSLTLRAMSSLPLPFMSSSPLYAPQPGFENGGELWFMDLTLPDETFLFATFVGLGNWLNIDMNTKSMVKVSTKARVFRLFFRTLAIVSVPIAAQMPMVSVI